MLRCTRVIIYQYASNKLYNASITKLYKHTAVLKCLYRTLFIHKLFAFNKHTRHKCTPATHVYIIFIIYQLILDVWKWKFFVGFPSQISLMRGDKQIKSGILSYEILHILLFMVSLTLVMNEKKNCNTIITNAIS